MIRIQTQNELAERAAICGRFIDAATAYFDMLMRPSSTAENQKDLDALATHQTILNGHVAEARETLTEAIMFVGVVAVPAAVQVSIDMANKALYVYRGYLSDYPGYVAEREALIIQQDAEKAASAAKVASPDELRGE